MPLAVLWLLGLGLLDHFSVSFLHPKIPDTYRSFIESRDRETVDGTVVESPERTEDGLRVVVRVERLNQSPMPPLKARLTLNFMPSAEGGFPETGDHVLVTTRLKRPTHFQDPGVFDSRLSLERKGILLSGFVANPNDWSITQRAPILFTRIFQPLRTKIRELLFKNIRPEAAGFLTALVVGDRSGISEELWEKFRRTGTAHLVAISGQHVGLVAMVCFTFCFWFLKRSEWCLLQFSVRRMAGTVAILPMVFYTLLAGAPPSAIRAMILVSLVCLAPWVRREVDGLSALGFAAVFITLFDPAAAFSASFQLSFLAVLGLLIFHKFEEIEKNKIRWRIFFKQYFIAPLQISFGASLLTAPLVAHLFYNVSFSGVLTNLWAVPTTGLLLIGSAVTLFFSSIPFLNTWCWWGLNFLTREFLAALTLSSRWSWVISSYPSFSEMLLGYGLIGSGILMVKAPKVRMHAFAVFILFLTLLALPTFLPLTDRLEITFLDVGQGDATLILTPDGHSLLVDGGGFLIPGLQGSERSNGFDVGERVVVPYLKGRGVKQIDAILLSHPHPDHYGGLEAVIKNFPVGDFWWNGQTFPDVTFDRLLSTLREKAVPMKTLRQNDRFDWNGLSLQVLYPREIHPHRNINDNSLVVKIISGNMSLLFSGDIEKEGEGALADSGLISAALLKIPHHASRTSSSIPFIDSVFQGAGPHFAVASFGEANMFGFPHEGILEKYERRGVTVFQTGKDGAVTFRVPPDFPTRSVSIRRASDD